MLFDAHYLARKLILSGIPLFPLACSTNPLGLALPQDGGTSADHRTAADTTHPDATSADGPTDGRADVQLTDLLAPDQRSPDQAPDRVVLTDMRDVPDARPDLALPDARGDLHVGPLACIGTWRETNIPVGCGGQDAYHLIDLANAVEVAQYEACVGSDPAQRNCFALCDTVRRRLPVQTGFFGQFQACEPACRPPGSPGVHVSWFGGCIGRRPEGMIASVGAPDDGSIGQHFARSAELEAASVPAFLRLEAELRAHGAPARLTEAAHRAAHDEIRHYHVTLALARHFGADARVPTVIGGGVRSLEEVASENATEGCVRETFGALVGSWQARRAGRSAIRTNMTSIARDEVRHAALSWEADAWLMGRLSGAARRRIAERRAEAAAGLRAEVESTETAPGLAAAVGLPGQEAAAWLLRGLVRAARAA